MIVSQDLLMDVHVLVQYVTITKQLRQMIKKLTVLRGPV